MKKLLYAFLPPLILALGLSITLLLPSHFNLQESAISPELPLSYDIEGWYGQRTQESENERNSLAHDTVFSKATYRPLLQSGPSVHVSIVFSGSDMNSSIHRPERCLPAQGHTNLQAQSKTLQLPTGKELTFTRLSSTTLASDKKIGKIHHINYYIFVGHSSIQSGHLQRTFRDMYDRVVKGNVQRWAYFQIGSYWGENIGITEQSCEQEIQELIKKITPQLINWKQL